MDPVLVCDDAHLRVARGRERRVPVTVHNPGAEEGHYRLEVLGEAARWAVVEPRFPPAVPGDGRIPVHLVLRPPQDAPTGNSAFALRCVSLDDATRCGLLEGEVTVGGLEDLEVRAIPVQSRRRSAQFLVQARNHGSVPATVELSASDSRAELRFAVAPRALEIAPGRTETAYLSVTPRRPRLRGGPIAHPFTVEHRDRTGGSDRVQGRFDERPLLGPAGALLAALLAVAVAGGGGALAWPSIRDSLHAGAAATGSAPALPGSASRTSAPAGTGTTTAGPGQPTAIRGHYVIWLVTFAGDTANQKAPERLVAALGAAGVPARVVDSRALPDAAARSIPARVVIEDGFPDLASADAACQAHRDLAPTCTTGG
jgi:hypothetical protein